VGDIIVYNIIEGVKAQNAEGPLKKVKELKMSVLTLRADGSAAVGESIMSTIAYVLGDNIRPKTTPQMIASLSKVRREKIIRVRQQLERGTYDLDERLDAVLDRILTDITPYDRCD